MKEEMKVRLQKALNNAGKKSADISRDLEIPKSAISQYLSGKTKKMDAERIYKIAKYLDVSEAWLMGHDVPMERPLEQKYNDMLVDIVERLRTEKEFRNLVVKLGKLNPNQIQVIKAVMSEFTVD